MRLWDFSINDGRDRVQPSAGGVSLEQAVLGGMRTALVIGA